MTIAESISRLGLLKSDAWSFQKEFRFVLWGVSGPDVAKSDDPGGYPEIFARHLAANPNLLGTAPAALHKDLKLAPDPFKELTVTLGPLSSPADRVVVEALLATYAPKATLVKSIFLGNIRPK